MIACVIAPQRPGKLQKYLALVQLRILDHSIETGGEDPAELRPRGKAQFLQVVPIDRQIRNRYRIVPSAHIQDQPRTLHQVGARFVVSPFCARLSEQQSQGIRRPRRPYVTQPATRGDDIGGLGQRDPNGIAQLDDTADLGVGEAKPYI